MGENEKEQVYLAPSITSLWISIVFMMILFTLYKMYMFVFLFTLLSLAYILIAFRREGVLAICNALLGLGDTIVVVQALMLITSTELTLNHALMLLLVLSMLNYAHAHFSIFAGSIMYMDVVSAKIKSEKMLEKSTCCENEEEKQDS